MGSPSRWCRCAAAARRSPSGAWRAFDKLKTATPDVVQRAVARVATYATLHLYRGELFARNVRETGDLSLQLFTKAQLDALVAALDKQGLPRTGAGPGLQTWLTYLQLLSIQAITTTNANHTSGQPGPVSTTPTQPQGGGGNNNGGNIRHMEATPSWRTGFNRGVENQQIIAVQHLRLPADCLNSEH